jgi:hypothetical protein
VEVIAMTAQREDPEALAGANRVGVIKLTGRNDAQDPTPTPLDLQVRKVLHAAPVSRTLATVIAMLAFSSGRLS